MRRRSVLFALLALSGLFRGAQAASDRPSLPYRFLLVISDQWKDPASYVIEGGGEFPVIASLLRTWGLPFDVLRLDQQRFDRYRLFDREGNPRFGTIIWDTGPVGPDGKDLSLLAVLVRDHGLGLVVLGDSVSSREVSSLAGLDYVSEYRLGDGLTIAGEHFLTRELVGREKEFLSSTSWTTSGSSVSAKDASVLVRRGRHPFLTVSPQSGAGRVVWLDAHRSSVLMERQIVRDLFKRCLVWAHGYALYAEYPKSMMLFMDDFGTSDRTYLPYWHYRTLNEDDIRKGLIEPLKRHKAVLMQDLLSGYVDRKTQRIINPWKQQVVDELDGKTFHDYVSAKRGLDAGLREGVFEIQCHGYTHMLPDLDSPPGPFWNAPLDGAATLGFDEEFDDRLRNIEVPAITQKYLLETALEHIRGDFGVRPLFVINGGSGWSHSYANHTARISAEMGFGLAHLTWPWYLGRDLVISMERVAQRGSWAHDKKLAPSDIPWSVDAPYSLVFHDRDVSLDAGSVERLLTGLGDGIRYMTANEYSAYLHARVERDIERSGPVSLAVSYDDHYCRYFAGHKSTWTLHLSDEMRRGLSKPAAEKRTVELTPGLGRRLVSVTE